MAAVVPGERNQDATLWVGGLDEKVTESLMHELFVQVGAVCKFQCACSCGCGVLLPVSLAAMAAFSAFRSCF